MFADIDAWPPRERALLAAAIGFGILHDHPLPERVHHSHAVAMHTVAHWALDRTATVQGILDAAYFASLCESERWEGHMTRDAAHTVQSCAFYAAWLGWRFELETGLDDGRLLTNDVREGSDGMMDELLRSIPQLTSLERIISVLEAQLAGAATDGGLSLIDGLTTRLR